MKIEKITIVGLGLIGGSLAKALKRTNPHFIITGVDTQPKHTSAALDEGIIDIADTNMENAVKDTQIVFLCIPVDQIPKLLKSVGSRANPGTIFSDVGSTKETIVKSASQVLPNGIYYIGGHPMAGTEHSGYASSMPHLFENAYYVLTPLTSTPKDILDDFVSLIASTGAIPLIMDSVIHDRTVGAVSHLPHVVASALVNTVLSSDDPKHYLSKLAAGGFKDITRIASSNPKMWRDISLSNKAQLSPLIAAIIQNLYAFGLLLEKGNTEDIESFFHHAKDFRDQLPSARNLHLLPYYELYVDVEDKPGIIGQVATLLGTKEINIKNIRIINSREDEPGCLVLSLPNEQAIQSALNLLLSHGYRAYNR